jgi:hypothetical protein
MAQANHMIARGSGKGVSYHRLGGRYLTVADSRCLRAASVIVGHLSAVGVGWSSHDQEEDHVRSRLAPVRSRRSH